MNEIKRYNFDEYVCGEVESKTGDYVLHSDHEAEVARLRDEFEDYLGLLPLASREIDARGEEVKRLRAELQNAAKAALDAVALSCEKEREADALRAEVHGLRSVIAPFAEYERVRSALGGTSPKSGQLLGVHSSAGSAELSVEDFKAAQAAMGESA